MSTATPSVPENVASAARAPGGPPPARKGLWGQVTAGGLVFALLAAIFAVGHLSGWKLPKASGLFGAAGTQPDDWCAEHAVSESQCVECNLKLMPKPKPFGFCKTHGVAECVICHPELAQVAGEPTLPAYDTAAALALVSRSQNNSRNMLHERRMQFASIAAADKAGLEVDVVGQRPMVESIAANGEIQFDPTRVAHLASRGAGTVAHVFKIVGDSVAAGDVLALIDVAAVGKAKTDLLQAIVQKRLRQTNLERMEAAGAGVSGTTLLNAKAALEEAEGSLISARQSLVNLGLDVPEDFGDAGAREIADKLRFLGIESAALAALPEGTKSANLYAVRAPYPGVIVASDSVVGEVVEPRDVLFTVADPRRLWLVLSVPQEDARYVTLGRRVDFKTEDGGQKASGKISWISPTVDQRTRTVQARVVLDNADGSLKDKTFGTGRIVLREEPKAVVVPLEAVRSTPDATFVFVRDKNYLKPGAPKVFHVRQVRTGARDGAYVELLAGALPGEVVATKGSAVILAQLLRGNLGEACCQPLGAKP